jgi:hypothetical protein
MNDATFTLVCGHIVRGVSPETACELVDVTPSDLLAYIARDPKALTDFYAAAMMRVRAEEVVGK